MQLNQQISKLHRTASWDYFKTQQVLHYQTLLAAVMTNNQMWPELQTQIHRSLRSTTQSNAQIARWVTSHETITQVTKHVKHVSQKWIKFTPCSTRTQDPPLQTKITGILQVLTQHVTIKCIWKASLWISQSLICICNILLSCQ